MFLGDYTFAWWNMQRLVSPFLCSGQSVSDGFLSRLHSLGAFFVSSTQKKSEGAKALKIKRCSCFHPYRAVTLSTCSTYCWFHQVTLALRNRKKKQT